MGSGFDRPFVFSVTCLLCCMAASSELRSFHAIGTAAQTDKAGYHELYEWYLGPRRHHAIRLLEIGLGCTMPYGPGASLQVRQSTDTLLSHAAVVPLACEAMGSQLAAEIAVGCAAVERILHECEHILHRV